jgi:hypothetical protein
VVARGGLERDGRSPEELQKITQKYLDWTQRLRAAGKLVNSNRLQDDGRVVRPNGGKPAVSDGPFSESKEAIGGYWLIEAKDYDEALKLIEDHPHVTQWRNTALEVRQIFDFAAYAR